MNDLFQTPELQPDKDYLNELVGEGKKFKDTQALARGKAESDNFIQTLTRQLDELRTDYLRVSEESKARANLEELLNRRQEPVSQEPQPRQPSPPPRQPDPVNIEELVDKRLLRLETQRSEEANLNKTRDILRERFGDDYQTKLRDQISSLGLDTDYVNQIARKSPEAVYRLLGLEQKAEPFQAPPRMTSLNSMQKAQRERTWSYYQTMKKERPTEYHSAKTNVQMHQDAQRLGEAFFDVD